MCNKTKGRALVKLTLQGNLKLTFGRMNHPCASLYSTHCGQEVIDWFPSFNIPNSDRT